MSDGQYTQTRLSRGQHRYGVDADWGVLDGVHNAHWRNLANTTKPSYVAAMWPYVKLLCLVLSCCCYAPSVVQ